MLRGDVGCQSRPVSRREPDRGGPGHFVDALRLVIFAFFRPPARWDRRALGGTPPRGYCLDRAHIVIGRHTGVIFRILIDSTQALACFLCIKINDFRMLLSIAIDPPLDQLQPLKRIGHRVALCLHQQLEWLQLAGKFRTHRRALRISESQPVGIAAYVVSKTSCEKTRFDPGAGGGKGLSPFHRLENGIARIFDRIDTGEPARIADQAD